MCATVDFSQGTVSLYHGSHDKYHANRICPLNTIRACISLKIMNKAEVVATHQAQNILAEKRLLFDCSESVFVLKLYVQCIA